MAAFFLSARLLLSHSIFSRSRNSQSSTVRFFLNIFRQKESQSFMLRKIYERESHFFTFTSLFSNGTTKNCFSYDNYSIVFRVRKTLPFFRFCVSLCICKFFIFSAWIFSKLKKQNDNYDVYICFNNTHKHERDLADKTNNDGFDVLCE